MWSSIVRSVVVFVGGVHAHTEFDSVAEIQKSSLPFIKNLGPENFEEIVLDQFRDYYKELEEGTDSDKIV